MPATTPSGSRKENRVDAGRDLVGVLALEQVRDAAGELHHLEAALHLARCVRKHLAVLVGDEAGQLEIVRLTSSRNAKSTLARLLSDACDQLANASLACCTASSTSSVDASATSACCSPIAGFHTGERRSPVPPVSLPPIQCSMVLIVCCPSSFVPVDRPALSVPSVVPTDEVAALFHLVIVVRRPGGLCRVQLRHLGHGNVPPGGAVGRRDQRVGLDLDDRGAGRLACAVRSAFSSSSIVVARMTSAPRLAALAARSTGQHVAVEAGAGAVAIAGAEPLRAERLRQRADRRVATVVDQHDDQLHALRDRGDDLRRHHQERAVADHDVDVAVLAGRIGRELHAETAGDLVAHAGEAVLDVVALGVAGPPELVQVSRHGAGGADHDVLRPRDAR